LANLDARGHSQQVGDGAGTGAADIVAGDNEDSGGGTGNCLRLFGYGGYFEIEDFLEIKVEERIVFGSQCQMRSQGDDNAERDSG
jgi:hypothetical protein